MMRLGSLCVIIHCAWASTLPFGWVDVGDASPDQVLELSFFLALPKEKVQSLEQRVLELANPSSPSYGSGWLSNDQVHAAVAPSVENVEKVLDFLNEHADKFTTTNPETGLGSLADVRQATPNGDVVTCSASVAVAEAILGVDFRVYFHSATNTTAVRTLSSSLAGSSVPEPLRDVVAFVGPANRFGLSLQVTRTPSSPLAGLNNPDTLRELYSVGGTLGGNAPANKQAVTAFLEQYYSEGSEEAFFEQLFPAGADTLPIGLVGDATEGVPPGVEAMLDIEYMPAMGALIPSEFWGFSGRSPNSKFDEPFLTWLYTVGNTSDADVPLVFSTSYGEDESMELPSDYTDRINAEFLKCAGRGISILFASGDSGAASVTKTCPNDRFSPKWPSASPWVTAVGGTQGKALPEKAWLGSSGGFSDFFAAPDWQANTTAAYLALGSDVGIPDSSFFNASGRGFPDISSAASEVPVVLGAAGEYATLPVAGTSCASPTCGGIFGLLNDARLAANKTSLGFLNPLLYANPQALNDVTEGSQEGCPNDGPDGFPTAVGWDAVTGLGSPNFELLKAVVLALP